jgi:hypothetical protein
VVEKGMFDKTKEHNWEKNILNKIIFSNFRRPRFLYKHDCYGTRNINHKIFSIAYGWRTSG